MYCLSRNTSQTKGTTSRRETRRGRREPPLPLSAKTAHKGCAMDGADAGTQRRRKGEAEAAQPAAFAERDEARARKHAPRNVEQVMSPEFKAWTRSSLIRNRSVPLRRAGRPERERGARTK